MDGSNQDSVTLSEAPQASPAIPTSDAELDEARMGIYSGPGCDMPYIRHWWDRLIARIDVETEARKAAMDLYTQRGVAISVLMDELTAAEVETEKAKHALRAAENGYADLRERNRQLREDIKLIAGEHVADRKLIANFNLNRWGDSE